MGEGVNVWSSSKLASSDIGERALHTNPNVNAKPYPRHCEPALAGVAIHIC